MQENNIKQTSVYYSTNYSNFCMDRQRFYGISIYDTYWWYAFLLPGTIAILCSLSIEKEENAGKYYPVFSMPVNLSKFETAKGMILIEKLSLIAAVFLAMLVSVSNIISPATVVYSVLQSMAGSIGIILSSVWQIPLCLCLNTQNGIIFTNHLEYNIGYIFAYYLGNTAAWWFVPYCYAATLEEPLMGIDINGTFAGTYGFSITILVPIMLSILFFIISRLLTQKIFPNEKREMILELTAMVFPLLISVIVSFNITLEEKASHFQTLLAISDRNK